MLMHGVTPLDRLWDTEEVDVPAGAAVTAAGTPQSAVYVVLYGHGAVRAPHVRGQDVAYGVSAGAATAPAASQPCPRAVTRSR